MPELAEIEANRRSLETCFGLPSSSVKIVKCITSNPFDTIIFDESCTKADLTRSLVGKNVTACCRKGKQMWIELSSGVSLLLHMGMTGAIIIENEKIPQYKAFKVEAETWPPRFTKLELELSNGTRIAFCDPRRLGRIRLRKSPALDSPPLSNLAKDPYLEVFDVKYLDSKLCDTSAPIKAVLLEQDRVFSGIGNYLADEILYQAAIHPKAASNTLSFSQIEELVKSITYVINTAVDFHCSGKQFPDNWIFHKRWSKGKKGNDNKLNGKSITFETVGGRTSAIVVSVQKMGAKTKTNTMKSSIDNITIKKEKDVNKSKIIKKNENKSRNRKNKAAKVTSSKVKLEQPTDKNVVTTSKAKPILSDKGKKRPSSATASNKSSQLNVRRSKRRKEQSYDV